MGNVTSISMSQERGEVGGLVGPEGGGGPEFEEKEDRISDLPDDIIHHILSFFDMKYAVRTCMLSKRWKYMWTSMPNIILNSDKHHNFDKFVNHALFHRNNHIDVSSVDLTFDGPRELVVKKIVNYAYLHNIRKLYVTRKADSLLELILRCYTLKHLRLISDNPYSHCSSLETLNLNYVRLCDPGDKCLDIFSTFVNLRELILHKVYMYDLKVFNVCAPQLSNLTITDPYAYPNVVNVVAPQLKSLTASVCSNIDGLYISHFLNLSTTGFISLEEVNLSLSMFVKRKEIGVYIPVLLDLFQKLCTAKFLILNGNIIKVLSLYMDQLSYEPCPLNNLKCLKIGKVSPSEKDHIAKISPRVRNYLLENSPSATFIMD